MKEKHGKATHGGLCEAPREKIIHHNKIRKKMESLAIDKKYL